MTAGVGRRTLGLLLLTDLTPREIVWGKMLSCGLTYSSHTLACAATLANLGVIEKIPYLKSLGVT